MSKAAEDTFRGRHGAVWRETKTSDNVKGPVPGSIPGCATMGYTMDIHEGSTLEQLIEQLPKNHKARKEYRWLRSRMGDKVEGKKERPEYSRKDIVTGETRVTRSVKIEQLVETVDQAAAAATGFDP